MLKNNFHESDNKERTTHIDQGQVLNWAAEAVAAATNAFSEEQISKKSIQAAVLAATSVATNAKDFSCHNFNSLNNNNFTLNREDHLENVFGNQENDERGYSCAAHMEFLPQKATGDGLVDANNINACENGRERFESWGGMSDLSVSGLGSILGDDTTAAIAAAALHGTGIIDDVTAVAASINILPPLDDAVLSLSLPPEQADAPNNYDRQLTEQCSQSSFAQLKKSIRFDEFGTSNCNNDNSLNLRNTRQQDATKFEEHHKVGDSSLSNKNTLGSQDLPPTKSFQFDSNTMTEKSYSDCDHQVPMCQDAFTNGLTSDLGPPKPERVSSLENEVSPIIDLPTNIKAMIAGAVATECNLICNSIMNMNSSDQISDLKTSSFVEGSGENECNQKSGDICDEAILAAIEVQQNFKIYPHPMSNIQNSMSQSNKIPNQSMHTPIYNDTKQKLSCASLKQSEQIKANPQKHKTPPMYYSNNALAPLAKVSSSHHTPSSAATIDESHSLSQRYSTITPFFSEQNYSSAKKQKLESPCISRGMPSILPQVKKRAEDVSIGNSSTFDGVQSFAYKSPEAKEQQYREIDDGNICSPSLSTQCGQTNQKWDEMFNCLLQYKEEVFRNEAAGLSNELKKSWEWDGNVPTTYKTKDHKALGRWINNQRSAFNKGTLKPDREERLVNAGLKWSVLSTNAWPDMMNELRIYVREKTKNGEKWDGNVPTNYKIKSNTAADGSEIDEEKNLGRWINRQRSLYQGGRLKKERKMELEAIGLKWSVLSTTSWETMYDALCEYVAKKREADPNNKWDGNVPANYKTENDNKSLGRWVNRQRSSYAKGRLKPEFITKLNQIGLKWAVHERKNGTNKS